MHFSSICGLGAGIADFGFEGPVFKSRSRLFFSIGKIVGVTEIRTRDRKIQSQLCLPLEKTDFSRQKNFVSQFTWCETQRPPPMGNQLENNPWGIGLRHFISSQINPISKVFLVRVHM